MKRPTLRDIFENDPDPEQIGAMSELAQRLVWDYIDHPEDSLSPEEVGVVREFMEILVLEQPEECDEDERQAYIGLLRALYDRR